MRRPTWEDVGTAVGLATVLALLVALVRHPL
jgi:hypothetical protein